MPSDSFPRLHVEELPAIDEPVIPLLTAADEEVEDEDEDEEDEDDLDEEGLDEEDEDEDEEDE